VKLHECRLCGNTEGNRAYRTRDYMFDRTDEWEYFDCAQCGCLQIAEYPDNESEHYPDRYYSLGRLRVPSRNRLVAPLRRWWIGTFLTRKGAFGRLASSIRPMPHFFVTLKRYGLGLDSNTLDVGCGNGSFLVHLQMAGFSRLAGIDPFIAEDIHYNPDLTIRKKSLSGTSGTYDVICMIHSFEHMRYPAEVLRMVYERLAPQGLVYIKIPILGYAWRRYGTRWANLDAPRHYYLHSTRSIGLILENQGFQVVDLVHDSNQFQFIASERNVALDERQHHVGGEVPPVLPRPEVRRFRREARVLNRDQDGDLVCIVARKAALGGDRGAGALWSISK